MNIIKDFFFFLKELWPFWKELRAQRKHIRATNKRKEEEGLVATFLYEFEKHVVESVPEGIAKLILAEFCSAYFQLPIEEKSSKDIELESTLIGYMNQYQISL